jgi:hypothetical protein
VVSTKPMVGTNRIGCPQSPKHVLIVLLISSAYTPARYCRLTLRFLCTTINSEPALVGAGAYLIEQNTAPLLANALITHCLDANLSLAKPSGAERHLKY